MYLLHPTNVVLATAVDADPDAPQGGSALSPKKGRVGKWGSGGARDDPHRRLKAGAGPSSTRVDAAERALRPCAVVCTRAQGQQRVQRVAAPPLALEGHNARRVPRSWQLRLPRPQRGGAGGVQSESSILEAYLDAMVKIMGSHK